MTSPTFVVAVTVVFWPTTACLRPSPVATLVWPTALVVSRTPRFWMERRNPSVSTWQSRCPFSWGCSGKAWRARVPIRSPICFCTRRTSVGLPWFRACSVKLQLLWMFSFPCNNADSWLCSTCKTKQRIGSRINTLDSRGIFLDLLVGFFSYPTYKSGPISKQRNRIFYWNVFTYKIIRSYLLFGGADVLQVSDKGSLTLV